MAKSFAGFSIELRRATTAASPKPQRDGFDEVEPS
jgi:hypothetical protein